MQMKALPYADKEKCGDANGGHGCGNNIASVDEGTFTERNNLRLIFNLSGWRNGRQDVCGPMEGG